MSFKKYLQLAKPGIIFGNLITLTGGFLLATHRHIGFEHLSLYLYVMIGVALMIGSGCVFNNCIDQDIDAEMTRTKNRPLVTGQISTFSAIIYGMILLTAGSIVLYYLVNPLTLWIILVGFVVYVVVYTIMKRYSVHATLLGGISGAIPPVAGYTALTSQLDLNALSLFLILFFWQIPHSYAISIRHMKDYKRVGIPLLVIVKGLEITKKMILVYMVLFILSCALPFIIGTADIISFIITMFVAIFWLVISIKAMNLEDEQVWSKKVFLTSVWVITVICLSMG
ncbi:heme o synthase [Pseudofrancisella aestuarii]|uniref:Protoheme IX farnesyltransferase n=1 Tax=Pseudofrancisella aestuarii TaxID=2670347 RepID=A0ABV9TD04_9GAMM|nr:heme o synthase [Pseudofrancisella aestuarii]